MLKRPMKTSPTVKEERSRTTTIKVIQRDTIPALRTVMINGEKHNLGILKDFRRHPDLATFIPEHGRLSMSWVHLESGEVLSEHLHPTASMIVLAEGNGRVTGDVNAAIQAGDIVTIPPGCRHGFVGAGVHGLWALSIQFEGLGLYEDVENGRVSFESAHAHQPEERVHPRFQLLLDRNERFARDHKENRIFKLVESGRLADQARRDRFFNAVQVWSTCFQRALFARSALVEDRRYAPLFREHLVEEFGHDTKLARDRAGSLTLLWDPVLDAASNWFVWKMFALDNAEKTVLIHLVLEVGSNLISTRARAIFDETDYFDIHAAVDDNHQETGLPLLRMLDEATYDRLFKIQEEGWEMLNLLCARIAEMADEP